MSDVMLALDPLALNVERLHRGRNTRGERLGLHGRYSMGRWHPASPEERAMHALSKVAPNRASVMRERSGSDFEWQPRAFCTRRLVAAVALFEPEHFAACIKSMEAKYAEADAYCLSVATEARISESKRAMERGVLMAPLGYDFDLWERMIEDYDAGRVLEPMRRDIPEEDIKRAHVVLTGLRAKIARIEDEREEEERRLVLSAL